MLSAADAVAQSGVQGGSYLRERRCPLPDILTGGYIRYSVGVVV